jgi:hypothetical protein
VDNGICVRMGAPPGRSGSRRPARVSKAEQLDGWCPFVACGLSIGSSARANDHRWEVAMLGHEDEWRLAAIEQQLLHDHPTFVRRLTRRMS